MVSAKGFRIPTNEWLTFIWRGPRSNHANKEMVLLFNTTKEIYDTLTAEGWKVRTDDREKNSAVIINFRIKNGPPCTIYFISEDDSNYVAVRIFTLISVSNDKREIVIPLLNDLNCEYNFFRFYCDEDGDVDIAYDYLAEGINPAANAKEIAGRMMSVADEVFPLLMRAVLCE